MKYIFLFTLTSFISTYVMASELPTLVSLKLYGLQKPANEEENSIYTFSAQERQERIIQEEQNKKMREAYEQQQREENAARAAEALKEIQKKYEKYETNIEELKKALHSRCSTPKIQQLLKQLDISDMKDIWADHAPVILALAHRQAIDLEETYRAYIRMKNYPSTSSVGDNYEIVLANKLTVERFDALKMREWFRLPS